MSRGRAMFTVVAASWFVTSCNPETVVHQEAGKAAGIYSLVSVNTRRLPATIQPTSGPARTFVHGTFVILSDGRASFEHAWDETINGQLTRRTESSTGHWVREGNVFTVVEFTRDEAGAQYFAEWNGADRLTVTYQRLRWVLER